MNNPQWNGVIHIKSPRWDEVAPRPHIWLQVQPAGISQTRNNFVRTTPYKAADEYVKNLTFFPYGKFLLTPNRFASLGVIYIKSFGFILTFFIKNLLEQKNLFTFAAEI